MANADDIIAAVELLGLPERASMVEIKAHFRSLIKHAHPDGRGDENGERSERTRQLIQAYRVILDYCHGYSYSFTREEVQRSISDEQWWFEKFGNDPLWSKGR